MKRKGIIRIGTSGWSYPHWRGTFYPEGLKQKAELAFYMEHFNTVELNNSFYRLPTTATFANWAAAAPPDFIYAVKASRFFTHMKKLNLHEDQLHPFFNAIAHLGDHLGPVLLQLPPHWKRNAGRLQEFLNLLPKGYRYAFEFRNPDWYHQEVYELLRTHQCACCWYHLAGHLAPKIRTTDFVYIRLHGPGAKYQGSYHGNALRAWAHQCRELSDQGRDVYVYFDNDEAGYAPANARKLHSLLSKS
jgi:uncharacterized protein YecE (DUF72 family)